jgi:hypothetical protein
MRAIFFSIFLLVVTSQTFAIGHDQGNGGNTVQCASGHANPKIYSLDYVLERDFFGKDFVLIKDTTFEKILWRIHSLIENKIPQLGPSFFSFLMNINNDQDPSQPFMWSANYDLPELNDQNFVNLPSFCRTRPSQLAVIMQAVVRETIEDRNRGQTRVLFHINPDAVRELDPLQKSFLYVHEWLWSLSSDVNENRKLNFLLHSELFENSSAEEISRQLQKYGIHLSPSVL